MPLRKEPNLRNGKRDLRIARGVPHPGVSGTASSARLATEKAALFPQEMGVGGNSVPSPLGEMGIVTGKGFWV